MKISGDFSPDQQSDFLRTLHCPSSVHFAAYFIPVNLCALRILFLFPSQKSPVEKEPERRGQELCYRKGQPEPVESEAADAAQNQVCSFQSFLQLLDLIVFDPVMKGSL